MRRKLIKQGGSGLTIYIPKKWVDSKKLKAGDELEIVEEGNKLTLFTGKIIKKDKKITIDITGLDQGSIVKTYTSLYESAYDEIKFKFEHQETEFFKKNEKVSVPKLIARLTRRFQGFAITSQGENFFVVKEILTPSEEEFDQILRRIFYLMLQFNDSVKESIENNNPNLLNNGEETYQNISSLISFCLRTLHKKKGVEIKQYNLHQLIHGLSRVLDRTRYLCDDLLLLNAKLDKKSEPYIEGVFQIFRMFYEYYYEPDNDKLVSIIKKRSELKRALFNSKLQGKKQVIITRYSAVFEIINSILKCVIAINFSKKNEKLIGGKKKTK